MDLSILVPWRPGDPDRERAWDYIRGYWEGIQSDLIMDIEIVEGNDTGQGPFNCAMAINDAFKKSTGRAVAIYGADCLPDVDSLECTWQALNDGLPWVPMYNRVDYYSKEGTKRILEGEYPCNVETDPRMSVPFQTAFLAMGRAVYKRAGGHDERFVGWGAEDSAFRRCLYLLFGDQESLDFPMKCLYHASGHRQMSENNWNLIREYENIHDAYDLHKYLDERGSWI